MTGSSAKMSISAKLPHPPGEGKKRIRKEREGKKEEKKRRGETERPKASASEPVDSFVAHRFVAAQKAPWALHKKIHARPAAGGTYRLCRPLRGAPGGGPDA